MPRWQPNARERLERAALELFAEQGYDDTTADQIAAAAGLNRSTFFRHFRDKREVLFGGRDTLAARLAESIENAPASLTVLEAIEAAFAHVATDTFAAERRDLAPRRLAIVASNPEFRERELLKRHDITTAVAAALRARGVNEPAATVAAELATLTFSRAVAEWAEPGGAEEFPAIAGRVLRELHAAAATLR
ncbi:helix-turn-helix domain-containing protein [Pseudonocardia zijingensis]|uniref:TetR/AcrR family transcriptional regulator n=1 Tax=Pseudonocardia zijingensis TaxID=153376 RepID=A0ABN1PEM8_9PSEU